MFTYGKIHHAIFMGSHPLFRAVASPGRAQMATKSWDHGPHGPWFRTVTQLPCDCWFFGTWMGNRRYNITSHDIASHHIISPFFESYMTICDYLLMFLSPGRLPFKPPCSIKFNGRSSRQLLPRVNFMGFLAPTRWFWDFMAVHYWQIQF
jgi:hypothetical protein